MCGLIRQMFIVLVLMVCFSTSLTMKYVSTSNQRYMVRPMLTDLSLHELHCLHEQV